MGEVQLKETVLKQLEGADEKLLRMVYAIIEAYYEKEDPVVSYDVNGNPRTASELKALLDEQVEEGRKGKYISIDELDQKSKQWLKHTR
ncbi:MAG: hypothetical protein KDD06_16965 [Phaeodactylibacter sp.]|nr:hypothetical protein [Phaeodactylibacter sp.]MCB9290883.1 hypothetical protein [Lewinellaceae bacterium]